MLALVTPLLILAILGTGVMAGVFYAFSGFVTQGIDRLPAADAARAMRGINVTAVRAPLMLALFGTGLVALAVLGFGDRGCARGCDLVGGRRRRRLPRRCDRRDGRRERAAQQPPGRRARGARGAGVGVEHVPPGMAGLEPRAHHHVCGGVRGVRGRTRGRLNPAGAAPALPRPLAQRRGELRSASAALLRRDGRGDLVRGLGEGLADRRGECALVFVERNLIARGHARERRRIGGGIG